LILGLPDGCVKDIDRKGRDLALIPAPEVKKGVVAENTWFLLVFGIFSGFGWFLQHNFLFLRNTILKQ